MIAPVFSPVPARLMWESPDIPIYLKWTYAELYSLSWTGAYYRQYLTESLEELADLLSQAEGLEQPLSTEAMAKRLTQLTEFGLVERRRVGRRWHTYLLLRTDSKQGLHRQPQTANSHRQPTATDSQQPQTANSHDTPTDSRGQTTDTPTDSRGQTTDTPTDSRGQTTDTPTDSRGHFKDLNTDVDDVVSGLDHHQQHVYFYLRKRGVFPKAALSFAMMCIPLAEVVGWGEYAYRQRQCLNNYAGLIVAKLGSREPAPDYELWTCPLCGQTHQQCQCGFIDALDAEESGSAVRC